MSVVQKSLVGMGEADEDKTSLGGNLAVEVRTNDSGVRRAILYRSGIIIKEADLSDNVAKKLFVVESTELGAMPSRLAQALDISRQTIHNYLEIKKHFGLEGLVQGYSPRERTSKTEQRKIHAEELVKGNKARRVEDIRKAEREGIEAQQPEINFSFGPDSKAQELPSEEQPFFEEHDWQANRYAGVFTYLITLIAKWRWVVLVIGHFGTDFKVFMIFLLMVARNIRSVEQLKNLRLGEAGRILGIVRIPCKPKVWEWFYAACSKRISQALHRDYFGCQMRAGLVGLWLWFVDGHLLPYTGKEQVHYSYNTQRRMPVPGQTSMVACDSGGRIVDFEIQEGKGDLRALVRALPEKWGILLPRKPVMVFDREGYGAPFFSGMVEDGVPFVTWDKYVDISELAAIEDKRFTQAFTFNGKEYAVFEDTKVFTHMPEHTEESGPNTGKAHTFTLRRIYIWNKSSKRRTKGLAWTGEQSFSTEDCARAILHRWGASENTFKHLKDRHPMHYNPGFALVKSEKQDVANPELKKKKELLRRMKKQLDSLRVKPGKSRESVNKDGTPRENSKREQLKRRIEKAESEFARLQQEKKALPDRVDVTTLANYRSFKRIDTEGKNLFDFVTSSVWNARKQMVDWLRPTFHNDNEVVDLFYAITNCHGWVKSTAKQVIVRLEPLEQPSRRAAQEQLCRKLTGLMTQTPMGKWMVLEVGECPDPESSN